MGYFLVVLIGIAWRFFVLQTLVDFFLQYGYAAVFSVLIFCGLGVPIPEDISLIAGGIISGMGYANPFIMTGIGMAGVLLGDTTMFYIGRIFGERFLNKHFVKRIITPARYKVILEWFDRYGLGVIFAGRFMPGLRSAIFLSAGITRFVKYPVFIIIDGFAAIISVPLWIFLGYYGASNWPWLKRMIAGSQLVILVAAVLFLLFIVFHTFIRFKVKKIEKEYSEHDTTGTL